MDKLSYKSHIIPVRLRVGINEDHAALDEIIRDYSQRMGMSMSTFVTEVLLDVLLKKRNVGSFRDSDFYITQPTGVAGIRAVHQAAAIETQHEDSIIQDAQHEEKKNLKPSPEEHEAKTASMDTDIYTDPDFIDSIIDLDDE